MAICRGTYYPAPGSAGRVCICGRSRPAHEDPDAGDIGEAERRLDRAGRRPDPDPPSIDRKPGGPTARDAAIARRFTR